MSSEKGEKAADMDGRNINSSYQENFPTSINKKADQNTKHQMPAALTHLHKGVASLSVVHQNKSMGLRVKHSRRMTLHME